jgi:N-acetylneuraminic acid mutarotase
MIIWGGGGAAFFNDGGRYNPAGNSWSPVSTTGAPAGRRNHSAVWTGSEMIIWGGDSFSTTELYFNDGGRYNPVGNSWTALGTTGAPSGRLRHTAVWTGSEMIVWGGSNGNSLNDGGRYNLASNSWTAASTAGAPIAREGHTAVWTGSEMIVWGGFRFGGYLNDTFSYTPSRTLYLYQRP